MQEYDVALKMLLRGSAALTVRALAGRAVAKWLDVELPKVQKVQNLCLDLLGQTAGGQLIHIELQSGNDAAMPFRMIEYCLGIQRLFGQFPRQLLLYVGEAPMHMQNELRGPDLSFQYGLIYIRTLDGDRLLESEEVGDNVIAILARLRDDKKAVHRIVDRIAGLTDGGEGDRPGPVDDPGWAGPRPAATSQAASSSNSLRLAAMRGRLSACIGLSGRQSPSCHRPEPLTIFPGKHPPIHQSLAVLALPAAPAIVLSGSRRSYAARFDRPGRWLFRLRTPATHATNVTRCNTNQEKRHPGTSAAWVRTKVVAAPRI